MRVVRLLTLLLLLATPVAAQVTIPIAFVNDTPANADDVNTDFNALGTNALNRTGGTITGNVGVSALVTIDGVDVGVQACTTCNPTFASVTTTAAGTIGTTLAVNSTGAAALDVAGGITAGTGNVAIIGTTGKIPALTSTYFTSAAVLESDITNANILARVDSNETITGNWTFSLATVFTAGLKEYGRTAKQGVGTSVAFNAGDFTASSGNWTLAAGDVSVFRYRQIGGQVNLDLNLMTTTVSATPTELRVAIPSGLTPIASSINACVVSDAGTAKAGIIAAATSGTYYQIQLATGGAFAAATDTTTVRCSLAYEITP